MGECGCVLAELYAKAAKERDEAVKLRRKAEERADWLSRKLEEYVEELNRMRVKTMSCEQKSICSKKIDIEEIKEEKT